MDTSRRLEGDTPRPTFSLLAWLLVFVAGAIVGYFMPHPSPRPRETPKPLTVEELTKIETTFPDPSMVGRYQFFTAGDGAIPMRGDTVTGKVEPVLHELAAQKAPR